MLTTRSTVKKLSNKEIEVENFSLDDKMYAKKIISKGFTNSTGCTPTKPKEIQRRAPPLSYPIRIVATRAIKVKGNIYKHIFCVALQSINEIVKIIKTLSITKVTCLKT